MALNVQTGTITQPGATGTQTTNLAAGFDPKVLLIQAVGRTTAGGGSAHLTYSFGWATDRGGTASQRWFGCYSEDNVGTADCYAGYGSDAVAKLTNGTTNTVDMEVDFVEFTSGGSSAFVLDWINLHTTASVQLYYTVIGGSDVEDALVSDFTTPDTISATDVTVASGFGQPSLILFGLSWAGGATPVQYDTNFQAGFGVKQGSQNGRMINVMSDHGATTQATSQEIHNATTVNDGNAPADAGTNWSIALGASAGWPTDGFESQTLTATAISPFQVPYLAIRFSANVTVTHGEASASTSTNGTNTLTSAGTPKFAFVIHTRQTTANTVDTTSTDDMMFGIGMVDGSGNERWMGGSDDDGQAGASVCGTYQADTKAIRLYLPSTNALDAEADIAVSGSNFVATWTDAAPSAFLYEWFTLGVTGGGPTTVDGGVATETNTAPAGTISQPQTPVSGEVAAEADTAPAGTVQLGTETTVSGGVAAETDAAPAGTISQPQTPVAGGLAGETDSAPAGTVLTETAGITQAAYTADKPTPASQTGPSYTITPDGADAPAIVTALSVVTVAAAPTTVAGGVASEADSAPAGTPVTGAAQTVAGGVASEDDTAPAGTATVVAGGISQAAYTAEKETPASQTGPSYTITPDGPAAVAIVTALSIRSVPATVISGGVASETDTAPAGALLAAQTIAGGVAQEADSAPAAAISTWPVIGPFIGSEMGYVPPGGLAEVVAVEPAVRTLGDLTVTTAGIARPTGQANTRSLGDPTVTGRHLEPAGQAHTRGQGTPTLSARALPTGQAHTRAQGTPSVNLRTLTPIGLSNTRSLGAPTATLVKIGRPDALTHTARALGAPTARGFMTAGPPSLSRTRIQGTPTLSGRALPDGLIHTRELGDAAVDIRTLQPAALDRA